MKRLTLSKNVYERYVDLSVEMFMECYANTICPPSDKTIPELDDVRLTNKCKRLIKADHNRKKLKGLVKGAFRAVKSAAVFAAVLLSLSSVLFLTVEAVRTPIMNIYIKEHDGNWEFSKTPFDQGEQRPVGDLSFNEKDPLGDFLPEDLPLRALNGSLDGEYSAVYYNDRHEMISFSCTSSNSHFNINTENANVEQLKISGYDAVYSERTNRAGAVLFWYNSDLDRYLALNTSFMSKEELIRIAENLNNLIKH